MTASKADASKAERLLGKPNTSEAAKNVAASDLAQARRKPPKKVGECCRLVELRRG